MKRVRVIDSHTEGEPTRVVIDGGPEFTADTIVGCVEEFRTLHDAFRTGVVLEPRGSDVLIGAILLEPFSPDADMGVIFFNNEGYLGMCGHGTIGLVRTLAHLGKCQIGQTLKFETPPGIVEATLIDEHRVSVANVPSNRYKAGVEVTLASGEAVRGDIAFGGNWFFIAETQRAINLAHEPELTALTTEIMEVLAQENITGEDGHRIDHIELWTHTPTADARNFVLCPGGAYDRSPCGTGTSAKLACLAADDHLAPGEIWRQESVIGSVFEGTYQSGEDGKILPTITGRAFITNESALLFENADPYRDGIRS